ncbi:MAG: alpha/beta fold hydrolase [Streptosporangiales bacterium]|nr:alpha/beta fold hydrolase [Streptosporangiales bacterium]
MGERVVSGASEDDPAARGRRQLTEGRVAPMTTAVSEKRVATLRGEANPRIQIAGEGPPVVYLHGAMGLVWDGFLDSLSQEHTVYAPEHPGTTPGDPDGIKAVDDLWDLVLHYYDLFDQLGLESPAIVGHSFGGMVAAEIAATNPDRASKLVLISPVGLWRDDVPVAQFLTMSPSEVAEIAFFDPKGPVAEQVMAVPEDPEAAVETALRTTWSQACTGKFMWPLPEKGLRKRLYRIKAPTLIVWGNQDRLVPPAYAEEFADRIANSRVQKFDKAAHLPQLEQLEAVSKTVREFLAG